MPGAVAGLAGKTSVQNDHSGPSLLGAIEGLWAVVRRRVTEIRPAVLFPVGGHTQLPGKQLERRMLARVTRPAGRTP